MADGEVSLRLSATASGIQAATAQVVAELQKISAAMAGLNVQSAGMGANITNSLSRAKSGAAGAGGALHVLGQDAHNVGFAIREIGEQATHAVGGLQSLREDLSHLGAALLAAFAIREIVGFAKSMADAAEQTEHTAITFGLTTSAVQHLKAEAAGLGIPFEAFTTAMQRSDRALTTAREGSQRMIHAFALIGVNAKEPIGQVELLNKEIAGLANVTDIPTRIGLAMQFFGRNIQQIAPLIGITKDQLAELNTTIDKSGAVSVAGEAAGLRMSEAFKMQKVAIMGATQALTVALAPAIVGAVTAITRLITAFTQSYNAGGMVRQVFDAIGAAIQMLPPILGALAAAWVVETAANIAAAAAASGMGLIFATEAASGGILAGVLGVVTAAWEELTAAMLISPIGLVAAAIGALVLVIMELTGKTRDQVKAEQELAAANAAIKESDVAMMNASREELAAIRENMVATETQTKLQLWAAEAKLEDAKASMTGGKAMLQAGLAAITMGGSLGMLAGDSLVAKHDIDGLTVSIQKLKAAMAGEDAQIAKIDAAIKNWKPPKIPGDLATPKKPKAEKADTSAITDEMQGFKTALDKMEDDEANWGKDMARLRLEFWTQSLATLTAFVNQEAAKYKDGSKQKKQILEEGAKAEAEVQHLIHEQRVAVYDEDQKAAEAASKSQSEMAKEAGSAALAHIKSSADAQKAAIEGQVEAGRISKAKGDEEIAALDKQVAAAEIANDQAALASDLAIENKKLENKRLTANEIAAINAEIKMDEQRTADEIGAISDRLAAKQIEDANKVAAAERATAASWVNPIVSAWSSGVEKMIEGTGTFRQAVAGVMRSMISDVISHMSEMVAKWITTHVAMKAISVAAAAFEKILHIGTEVAKTASTTAGAAARAAAETTSAVTGAAAQKAAAAMEIPALAAMAGAGGVASMAAAPFPIDLAAPGFGAAMFSAAMGYGAAAAAEGGWDEVPADDQMTQLHFKEMVLSRQYAEPLRQLLTTGKVPGGTGPLAANAANQAASVRNEHNATTTNNGGDLHFSPTIHGKTGDLSQMLKEQGHVMRKWFRNETRNGSKMALP